MRRHILTLLAVLFLGCGLAHAQANGGTCGYTAPVSTATITAAGGTQLIAAPTKGAVHICAWTIEIQQQATTAVNFGFTSGTGAGCATGTALVTPAFIGVAGATQSAGQTYTATTTLYVAPQTALCLSLSGAPIGAVAHVIYSIF